jgi:pimeloyl-ACP methyl ester carboxylesterase
MLRRLGWMAAAAWCALAGHAAYAQPLKDCRVAGLRNSVQCGVLQRALDPARPDGPKIDIHFVVAPAMARRKLPDPVFLLAGGPGQSAIKVAPGLLALFARINNRRDIVFVDQRGTGKSAPLDCTDPQRETLAEQADPDRPFTRLMECQAALLKLPYIKAASDLGFFTTTLAMQDLDAVRQALGAERINLIGASYGTRAALEYARQFPQALRRSVIDGVAPPDMVLPASFSTDGQAAFDKLLIDCEREPACAHSFPALRADWAALLAGLPRAVSAAHPLTGLPERFTLTREMVLAAVRGPLYAPAFAAALPAAISAAAQGRFEALVGLGSVTAPRKGTQLSVGMHFSVVCAEDLPLLDKASDAPGANFGVDQATLYRRACARWPRGAVPGGFYGVPASATPVLLLSGGLDPATPPRHGERVAMLLGANALHVVVPNAGHGVMQLGCMRDVIYRFVDAPDDQGALGVDAACVKSIPRPPMFVPVGVEPGASK